MILLLLALAVMVGGYFGVQQLNRKASVSETTGTFDLTAKTADDLAGLSWTLGNQALAFQYADGSWVTLDDPAWPVDQDALQDLADQLLALQATRKLEDVASEADYGLETPAITVTASWKDGSSTAYSMGDATPFADGYYLKLSGQTGTIYTIASSLSTAFNKSQSDLVVMEAVPAVAEAVRLTVGQTFDALKKETSTTIDPDQLWYDAATDVPLDGTRVESLISAAQGIAWVKLVTAAADAESLSAWQLDEDQAVKVTLTAADGEAAVILFGSTDENGDYYARLPDSAMVYTVEAGDVSSLITASAADMGIQSILPLPYDQLAEAAFTTEKGTYHLTKAAATGPADHAVETSAEEPAADPEDPSAPQEASEADNSSILQETSNAEDSSASQEASEAGESSPSASPELSAADDTAEADSARKNLWELVTSLKAAGQAEGKPAGDQVLTIHAVSTTGPEATVSFYEYSADAYLAVVDEGTPQLVSADAIDTLTRTVRTMK